MMADYILAAAEDQNILLPGMPDLVWGSIAFVIVALVVGKLAWPTFMETLDERKTKIEDGLSAAANAKKEVASQREALTDEINNAHREAAEIRNKAKDNAVEIARVAKADAASEAERITSNAERQIEADTTTAKKALEKQISTLAVDLAEKIVGAQALDPDISQGVIDRFLDDLEAQNAQIAKAEVKEN
ncbi:F0F1 ATP synthase subunit B [Ancrocorticia populi]|uniref:F0F1 ATP synthase subunit B n=1 Tax=Ancrocorticia populi TaxID=2175228 RepID=UPI003F91ADF1